MRHGHAMAQTRRAQAFAGKQIVRDGRAGDAVIVFEDQAGLLEGALFTGDFQVQQDVFEG
ncbi:hypothetical protein D3C72_2248800 [compost metagenome]